MRAVNTNAEQMKIKLVRVRLLLFIDVTSYSSLRRLYPVNGLFYTNDFVCSIASAHYHKTSVTARTYGVTLIQNASASKVFAAHIAGVGVKKSIEKQRK